MGLVAVSILLIFLKTTTRKLTGILPTKAKKLTAKLTTNNVGEKSMLDEVP